MGGIPQYAFLSIALPKDTDCQWSILHAIGKITEKTGCMEYLQNGNRIQLDYVNFNHF
jgi:thiamine monophosphate kinase